MPLQMTVFEILRKPKAEPIADYKDEKLKAIINNFLATLDDGKTPFTNMLSIRTDYQLAYSSFSDAIWKASVNYCHNQSIEWFLKTSYKMHTFKDFPKKVQQNLIDSLLCANSFKEIDYICEEICNKYQYLICSENHFEYLSPSDYAKVMILKAKNEKEMAQILNCCGGISVPKKHKEILKED